MPTTIATARVIHSRVFMDVSSLLRCVGMLLRSVMEWV